MAKQKALTFTASMRVLVIIEVPVAGTTMEEALQEAKNIKVGEALGNMTGIVDYEGGPEVVSLSSNRWLD